MIRKTRLAKIAAVAAGFSMALTSAMPVGAVTIAELQAQIAALMAQLNALQGGTTTTVSVSFTRDLTIGSSGAEVTALQQTLVAQGYLTMPAGVAYGYFGSLTKSAVARWQAAVGLPATGFFGPMSRAKLNAVGGTTTGGSTTGGTTTGGSAEVITTPGAEGTISVTSAPVSDLTLDEGQSMAPVVAFQVKATGSDEAVQRVKLDLGNSTAIYNKILSRVYLVDDAGKTLASADLNSTNVVKDGSNYFITLSGFSSVVSKNATRTYTVKADVRGSIDSTDRATTRTITLPVDGVRAVDGAGIDDYGPSSAISNTFTVDATPVDAAKLTVSLDPNTAATRQVIAASGTNENEADKVALLTFDVKAEKDSVKITDITANVTAGGSSIASSTVFYLYAGNTLLDSTANTSTSTSFNVVFDNLNYTVAKDSTAALSISADIRNANANASTLAVTVSGSNIVSENSVGDTTTSRNTGSAAGNTVTIYSAGPELTLVSKSISKTSNSSTGNGTAQGTFNIQIKAVGGDVVASTTGAFLFDLYENGVATSTTIAGVYSFQNGNGVSISGSNATIQEGTTVTLPVNVVYTAPSTNASKLYAFGLDHVSMNNTTINYMDGKLEWRTDSVVLP